MPKSTEKNYKPPRNNRGKNCKTTNFNCFLNFNEYFMCLRDVNLIKDIFAKFN